MALFPSYTSTTEESLLALRMAIRKNALDNFNQFVEVQNDWIRFIWHNEAFSAQTICNALSSDAVQYFNLTNNLRTFVLSGLADNVMPDVYTVLKPLSAYSLSGGVVTIFNAPYVGP